MIMFRDVLRRADGGDLVEWLGSGQITDVAPLDAASIAQPSFLDAVARPFRLGLAEGDAECLHAIVFDGELHQSAPAASDIEEALARLEAQLLADVVELRGLCRGEVVTGRAEIAARVLHVRIEPHRIQLVADAGMKLVCAS